MSEQTPLINKTINADITETSSIASTKSEVTKNEGVKIEDSITLAEVKKEAEILKDKLVEVKLSRRKLYLQCKQIDVILKIINNVLIFLSMIFTLLPEINEDYKAGLSVITAFFSMTLWLGYTKKAEDYLLHSTDLQSAEDIVNACFEKIKDIQSDGIVTKDEQVQISNIMLNLDVQLGALSTCTRLVKLVTDVTADTDIKDLFDNFKNIKDKYNSQQK